jgi:hypothetical protein
MNMKMKLNPIDIDEQLEGSINEMNEPNANN